MKRRRRRKAQRPCREVCQGPLGRTGICWRLVLAVLQRFGRMLVQARGPGRESANRRRRLPEGTRAKRESNRLRAPREPRERTSTCSGSLSGPYVSTFSVCVQLAMRPEEYPAERTRCIYSSGSADSSLFCAARDQFRDMPSPPPSSLPSAPTILLPLSSFLLLRAFRGFPPSSVSSPRRNSFKAREMSSPRCLLHFARLCRIYLSHFLYHSLCRLLLPCFTHFRCGVPFML